jgi:hypothetical protein
MGMRFFPQKGAIKKARILIVQVQTLGTTLPDMPIQLHVPRIADGMSWILWQE